MCIFLFRSADDKCPAKQDIYNMIFIQEEALLSRCCEAVGDGSRYDPNFKLCQLATATHSTPEQQCEECTAAMQPWKGMGMKEAMLNTIAENPKATPIPVNVNEKPTDELANAKSKAMSASSAPKETLAVRENHTADTVEQTRATNTISSHAAFATTISATVNSPEPSSRPSTVKPSTTAPPSLPGFEQFTTLSKPKKVRAATPSNPAKFAQTAPSPTVRNAPANVCPTMNSQPNTGQQFQSTHPAHAISHPYATQPLYATQPPNPTQQHPCPIQQHPFPTQQAPYPPQYPHATQIQQPGSLKRQSENNTLRDNNKRLRSGMTQLAIERAAGARDIAQLLAYNERQATRIEELEAELEELRARVAAVEGRRG